LGFASIVSDCQNKIMLSSRKLNNPDDDLLATDVSGRKVEADELSEMTIQRAASWIQQCNAEHADNGCKTVDTDLPPKVIDVSVITEPEVVISYTPDAEKGRYAVLSHMSRDKAFWEYKGNPAIMFLPKVFQDAIIVTRKLGLRYLWIDALWYIPFHHQ
jgi:hypothetical protein